MRRYNADLANDLGNLLNRTVSMANRYLDGRLPAPGRDRCGGGRRSASRGRRAPVEGYRDAMERQHLDEALAAVMDLVRAANGYAESQAPWSLDKAGDTERLGQVLAAMAEACRILGHLVAPFTPRRRRALHEQLGVPRRTTSAAPAAGRTRPPGAAVGDGCAVGDARAALPAGRAADEAEARSA